MAEHWSVMRRSTEAPFFVKAMGDIEAASVEAAALAVPDYLSSLERGEMVLLVSQDARQVHLFRVVAPRPKLERE